MRHRPDLGDIIIISDLAKVGEEKKREAVQILVKY